MPNGNAGTFYRAEYKDLTPEQIMKDFEGEISINEARRFCEQLKREVLYLSEHYQVAIDKHTQHGFKGMLVWHLSIKRRDKEAIMDWRDLQDIKNKLVGEETEAIQLFPAESRCVDSANQYHLYAFMKAAEGRQPKIPVGWTSSYKRNDGLITGKQRPFDAKEK